jgi:hypothetical protein
MVEIVCTQFHHGLVKLSYRSNPESAAREEALR